MFSDLHEEAVAELESELFRLRDQLQAARVAAQSLPVYRTDDARIHLNLDDVLEINVTVCNVRRALGLEVKP